MKKYITYGLLPFTLMFVTSIIFSLFNLFSIEVNKFFFLIFIVIIMLVSGFYLGLNIKDKGYLKGLLYGVIISCIMFILSFILASSHSLYNIIYYTIVIASTTLGTMIGINKK